MSHKFQDSANWLSDDGASEMSNMHLFGDVRWGEIDNDFLFFCLDEGHIVHKFIDSILDEFIFEFYLEESFVVGCYRTDVFVLEMVFLDFFGEFYYTFATETCSFFFVFVNVELLHGWGRDILALSFGAVLEKDIWLDAECFVKYGS